MAAALWILALDLAVGWAGDWRKKEPMQLPDSGPRGDGETKVLGRELKNLSWTPGLEGPEQHPRGDSRKWALLSEALVS